MEAAVRARRILIATLAGSCFAAAVAVAPAAGRAGGAPNVVQVSYGETYAQQGPDHVLDAFAKHTNSTKFTAYYNGEKARAPGKYHDDITDTDIHNEEASHPWWPDREHGGGRVVRFVHKSLEQKDRARVRVKARGNGQEDHVVVVFKRSECASDPPSYPISCEEQF
jgi:hypothetical protein